MIRCCTIDFPTAGFQRALIRKKSSASFKLSAIVILFATSLAHAKDSSCEAGGTCTVGANYDTYSGYGEGIDIEDPCTNDNPYCPKWAAEGECRNNPNFMRTSCSRACGVCPPIDEAEKEREEIEIGEVDCEDLHEMCHTWASEGTCKESDSCQAFVRRFF